MTFLSNCNQTFSYTLKCNTNVWWWNTQVPRCFDVYMKMFALFVFIVFIVSFPLFIWLKWWFNGASMQRLREHWGIFVLMFACHTTLLQFQTFSRYTLHIEIDFKSTEVKNSNYQKRVVDKSESLYQPIHIYLYMKKSNDSIILKNKH